MSDGQTVAVPEGAVRDALALILASADLIVSERNRRFLRHVVEKTLAGRADRIKAYSIATTVFGQPDDFDPLQDAIVRVEADGLMPGVRHRRHEALAFRQLHPDRITMILDAVTRIDRGWIRGKTGVGLSVAGAPMLTVGCMSTVGAGPGGV